MISLEDKGAFRIGGRVFNNLRYADDTVILAETEHELQHLMDIVVQESEQKGLFLNIYKSYLHHGVQQVIIHTYMSD